MTERKFLTTANTEADVQKIADWYGWQVEEDNSGQLIIYTDIPEGAPEVAQEAAEIYDWDYDSDNLGAILLYTGVCSDEQIRRDEKNGLYPGKRDPCN
jgi:Rieske Fe-S protein